MNTITNIDFIILDFIRKNLSCKFMDVFMPMVTKLVNGGFICIVTAIVLLFIKKYRKAGVILAVTLFIGLIVGNIIIKNAVLRVRPCVVKNIDILIKLPKDYSFPSGHTLASVITAIVLFRVNNKIGSFAFVIALLVAFSRMYLYVHYPSDILAGAGLGIIITVFVQKMFDKYWEKNKKAS